MQYSKIKALVITLDEDFFYKIENLAKQYSFETKSSDYLDWTYNFRDDFKRILIHLLANYDIEKDYYNNNLKLQWLEQIPVACLPNQYILIRDKENVKRMK